PIREAKDFSNSGVTAPPWIRLHTRLRAVSVRLSTIFSSTCGHLGPMLPDSLTGVPPRMASLSPLRFRISILEADDARGTPIAAPTVAVLTEPINFRLLNLFLSFISNLFY